SRASLEAGIRLERSLEVPIDAGLAPDTGAARAMEGILDGGGPRPVAVSAFNAAAALAAMRVCLARGLRVPEDIALVGFDDIPGAAHAAPPLTTLAVDKEALGRRGVELLLADAPEETEIRLPVRLIERASSSAAAHAPRPLTPVIAS
ncbi:substrate-binding domain-containing protein, partial [Burkholderia glumae]|uniref:substrate-binding domain-containing protein n=1 Tax=Burkholderia glumae TaxID=337 RepID=UPI000CADF2B4